MNKELRTNSILFSLLFVFILNTGMVERNIPTTATVIHTNTQSLPQKQSTQKIKWKHKRKRIKELFKTHIVDEGALLIAVLAVGLAGVAVYFFFTMSFLTGVIALVAAVFLLYYLFRYLEY